MFSLIASFTKTDPGSETHGVPASDINETILSDFNKPINFSRFFFSLNLWFDISLFLILYFSNNFFETLVSSQIIKCDWLKTSIALKEISERLPIGVETI